MNNIGKNRITNKIKNASKGVKFSIFDILQLIVMDLVIFLSFLICRELSLFISIIYIMLNVAFRKNSANTMVFSIIIFASILVATVVFFMINGIEGFSIWNFPSREYGTRALGLLGIYIIIAPISFVLWLIGNFNINLLLKIETITLIIVVITTIMMVIAWYFSSDKEKNLAKIPNIKRIVISSIFIIIFSIFIKNLPSTKVIEETYKYVLKEYDNPLVLYRVEFHKPEDLYQGTEVYMLPLKNSLNLIYFKYDNGNIIKK